MKITIANEEVLCSNNFTINQEMLNTPSVILNNVYPKSWELDKDYSSRFYHPNDYSQCKIFDEILATPGETITGNPITANIDLTKLYEYKINGETNQKTKTGKNLIPTQDTAWEQGTINQNTGEEKNDTTRLRTIDFYPITPGTYYASMSSEFSWINIEFYKSDQTFLSAHGGLSNKHNTQITVPTNAAYYKPVIRNSSNSTILPSAILNAKPQIETGTSKTTWEEYTGGIPSPNPSYPQQVENVTGTQTINVSGNGETIQYTINLGSLELCKIGTHQDYLYKENGKWYKQNNVDKLVLTGAESWNTASTTDNYYYFFTNTNDSLIANEFNCYSDKFAVRTSKMTKTTSVTQDTLAVGGSETSKIRIKILKTRLSGSTTTIFKNWLNSNNVTIYYIPSSSSFTEITDNNLINQLNAVSLVSGTNTLSIDKGTLTLHYNFTEAGEDIYFCGVVKNSGNISLNPRYPHYSALQILDYKTFLSEGETLDFVIANKTILEAIEQVISVISGYGFELGNVDILGANEVIGAYSTKDKTAYDVFNYLADITQSRWTTRTVGVGKVAIDFYDPSLMPEGISIEYNQNWFCENKIMDMTYNYGTWDYRNKQVMTSNAILGSISQSQTIITDGYSKQYSVEQTIGQITSVTLNGIEQTIATNEQKSYGIDADIYYTPGNNNFSTNSIYSVGSVLIITYIPIVEGRQIINNITEIERVNEATGVKGVVSRYENRNDATTSLELQKIGQSYIKYKGVPEIKLNIKSQNNLWDIGDRVYFNAPIPELETEYMVKSKKINYVVTANEIFYDFELASSFNSEQSINYFDNQRAKTKGNIGEGEYITRNVDIESSANIIFFDTNIEEVTIVGDNILNCALNSPFVD